MLPWRPPPVMVLLAAGLLLALPEGSQATPAPDSCSTDPPPCVTDDDQLRYSPMINATGYKLRDYQADKMYDWTLTAYVDMARGLILDFNTLDWAFMVDIFQGNIEIQQSAMDFAAMEPMVLVGCGLGLLIALVLPFVACFTCCCRCCCGKCGSKLSLEEAHDQSKLCCFLSAVLLLVICVMLLVGIGALYTVGERIPNTANFTVQSITYSIDDLLVFKSTLFDQLGKVTGEDLDFSIDVLLDKLNNVGDTVVGPFMAETRPLVRSLVDGVVSIDGDVQGVASSVDDITTSISRIEDINTLISSSLTGIGVTMDTLIADCNLASPLDSTPCDPLPDSDWVPDPYDFSNTPSISDQVAILDDAQTLNLTSIAQMANTTFEDLPNVVSEQADATISSVRAMLDNVTDSIGPSLDDTELKLDESISAIDDQKEMLNGFVDAFEPFASLITYAFMGLGGIVFLVLLPALLGCLCGSCGYRGRPEKRKKIGSCAYCCLLTSTFFSVFIGFIFLLIGSILFFVGANFTMVCQGFLDLSIFDNFIDKPEYWNDKYHLGSVLFQNDSYEFPIKDVLIKCQNNKAIYEAMRLNKLIDMENMVNLTEQMPDLGPLESIVEDAVGDMDLVSNSSKDTMTSIKDSDAINMDITGMMGDLNQGLDDLTFDALISKLGTEAAALDSAGFPTLAARYRTVLEEIEIIDNTTKPNLGVALDHLTGNLTLLQDGVTSLVNTMSDVMTTLNDLETTISESAATIVLDSLKDFLDSIFDIADQILNYVIDLLNNDIGRCSVVYDVYMGFVNTICVYFLDAFNAIWMSFCICGFFSAMNFVVSLVYSKYVRQIGEGVRTVTLPRRRVHYGQDAA